MHKSFAFLREPKIIDKKNIVFLDIDGVIQAYSQDSRFNYELNKLPEYFSKKYNDPNFLKCNIYDLGAAYFDWDEIALARIKQILRDFNAYIVIHSGWRESVPGYCLKALFKLYDMDDYILDVLETGRKEDVIKKYIEDYSDMIDKYIVIDDDFMTSSFGINFCHTYNLFDSDNHLYVNRLFFNNYELSENLEFLKNGIVIANINKKTKIFDGKIVNIFNISFVSKIDNYEILMVNNELKKYCAKNNVWCMCLEYIEEDKEKYSMINKNTVTNNKNNYYILSSPINNFSDVKEIREKKEEII